MHLPHMRGQDHADTYIGQRCLQCLRRKDFILRNLDGQESSFSSETHPSSSYRFAHADSYTL